MTFFRHTQMKTLMGGEINAWISYKIIMSAVTLSMPVNGAEIKALKGNEVRLWMPFENKMLWTPDEDDLNMSIGSDSMFEV